ncbi:50S ribosomal protein L22 [Patescibacteria group bacterium]|nr:50S ribosomal protein L22 [Patescibacteria group bacterium]
MQVKATSKYLRISPKKMRLVVDLIRGMNAQAALDQLDFIPKRASLLISKVLKSAIANAEHNFKLKKENLFIKEIFINQGPTLKRWRARAFGRAAPIRKRSSHLEIVLGEKVVTPEAKPVKPKLKEPVIEAAPKEKAKPKEMVSKKEPVKKELLKGKGKEVFDTRRQGKRRAKQHLDKTRAKKVGGVLKRVFRRKSI